jgi:hypothetical protein
MDMQDFSFQGKIWLGERDVAGKPKALAWVGDAPTLQLKFSTDKSDRTESFTGNRVQSAQLKKGKKVEMTMTLNYFGGKQLALGLYGTVNTIAGGTATAEAFPDDVVVGDTIALARGNVSDVVVTDSATSSPATLTANTDYAIESAAGGLITVKSLGAYTQPFKAAYAYAGGTDVTMFTGDIPERYLMLDGINTVDNSRVIVRLWRCAFDPIAQLDLISDDFGQLQLGGSVLFDTINAADTALGGFGRIELAS